MTEHESLPTDADRPDSPAKPEPLPQDRIDRELRLKFSDFVPLLPESLLNVEAAGHDADLIFDLAVVVDLVTNGCSRVPIAWVRQRVPFFFREAVQQDGFACVLFPWQKVRRLIRAALHPNAQIDTTECRGLTPAGAKYLASNYQFQRASARHRPAQCDDVPSGESSEQSATVEERPADLSSPPCPAPSPVNTALQVIEGQTVTQDADLPAAELLRQRDLARHELARVKGEAERRVATVRAELKTMTDERDDALAALAIFEEYESNQIAQLEFENAVQKKSLERALAELEAVRARLAAPQRDPEPTEPHPSGGETRPQPGPLSDSKAGTGPHLTEKTTPSTSAAGECHSSSVVRRRAGGSGRALKVARSFVLMAIAFAAIFWAASPLFEKWLPPQLIPFAVLAGEVEGRAAFGAQASAAKASGAQVGSKPAQAPSPTLRAGTVARR